MIPVPMALPPEVVDVVPGDVDGDGVEDLILVSSLPQTAGPDRVTLTLLNLDDQGQEVQRRVVELGNEPLIWDVWGGLWAMDGQGLLRLDPDGGEPVRVATLTTILAGLGPTTPLRGSLAQPLFGEGEPALILYGEGQYHAFRPDGTALGSVQAPSTGALSMLDDQGGAGLAASREAPSLVIEDVDGDGLLDLVLPGGRELVVHFTGPEGVGVRQATLTLPVDLAPEEGALKRQDEVRRRITGVWLKDLTGDGRMDLGLHRMVLAGSWFGTTAELVFAEGTGSGFAQPQIVISEAASFFGLDVDADGDGDVDLMVPRMDTGLTSLGRALVTRSLPVDLDLFEMGDGLYISQPRTLMRVAQPVEGGDGSEWVYSDHSDVDGDGLPDLVRRKDEETLQVFLGRDLLVGGKPSRSLDVDLPEEGKVMVHDVTGYGRAEIFLWVPRTRQGILWLGH